MIVYLTKSVIDSVSQSNDSDDCFVCLFNPIWPVYRLWSYDLIKCETKEPYNCISFAVYSKSLQHPEMD